MWYFYWIGVLLNLGFFLYGFKNNREDISGVVLKYKKPKTLATSLGFFIMLSWLSIMLVLLPITFKAWKEYKK